EDRRREDAGDRRSRDPQDLVRRASDQGAHRLDALGPGHQPPILSRRLSASELSAIPIAPTRTSDPIALPKTSHDSDEITGSRIPSTMKLSGLYRAIVAAGPVSRSWGKNAEERNRITKTSGKSPCTTEARPVRSATA